MSEVVRAVEEAAAKLNLTTIAGLDLARSVSLVEAINVRLGTDLSSGVVADHPDVGRLAAHIESVLADRAGSQEVAIVGLDCRAGDAADPDQFWDLVRAGRDVTTEISDPVALRMYGEAFPGTALPRYGAMPDTDAFDPAFFRISPTEAAAMDAAQRVLLESSYHALEDAAIDAAALRGQRVGTVVGTTGLAPQAEYTAHSLLGSDTSVMVSRLAYHLDLAGPALAVDTACSSSLVAIDVAVRLLLSDQADVVLAGGVYVCNHPGVFLTMQALGTVSGTRRCRPFDAGADGMLVGEGVGMLVLKRLSDAVRDNDRVHGVIRASGTNQDGRTSGITAPSTQAQATLLREVLGRAGVPADRLGYFEAHGTGTTLGDPIEIAGITAAYSGLTDRTGYLPIGSVKANIGHTMGAAGVLGVIKALLSMRAGVVPPAANFTTPNPHIDFAAAPVRVVTEPTPWEPGPDGRRHAAVSSFGYSGTNAHLVLSDHPAPTRPAAATPPRPQLVPLSARTAERLRARAGELAAALRGPLAGADLVDVAYTLQVGREPMAERAAVVAGSIAELADRLDRIAAGDRADADAVPAQLAEPARQWTAGEPVAWARLHLGAAPRRIGLPGYPFERNRYSHAWADGTPIERPTEGGALMTPRASAPEAPPGPADQVDPVEPAGPAEQVARSTHVRHGVPGVPSMLSELDAAAAAHFAEHPDRTSLRAALEADALAGELAELCERLLLASLRRMGVFATAGERYTVDELIKRLDVVAEHHLLVAGLVRLLADAGYLTGQDGAYTTTAECAAMTLRWEKSEVDRLTGELLARRPEMAGFARLLTSCLDAYPEVLTGKRKAHEVLFPGGSFTAVEDVYHSDQDANALVARLVGAVRAGPAGPRPAGAGGRGGGRRGHRWHRRVGAARAGRVRRPRAVHVHRHLPEFHPLRRRPVRPGVRVRGDRGAGHRTPAGRAGGDRGRLRHRAGDQRPARHRQDRPDPGQRPVPAATRRGDHHPGGHPGPAVPDADVRVDVGLVVVPGHPAAQRSAAERAHVAARAGAGRDGLGADVLHAGHPRGPGDGVGGSGGEPGRHRRRRFHRRRRSHRRRRTRRRARAGGPTDVGGDERGGGRPDRPGRPGRHPGEQRAGDHGGRGGRRGARPARR